MSLRPGAVNFEEKWSGLQETIHAVVQLSTVRHSTWNDHYSDIYALCEAFPKSYAETLYEETQDLLRGFVEGLLEKLAVLGSRSLLSSYQHHWLCYQQGAKFLDNLFSYFNRVPLRKYQPQHDLLPCHVLGIATPIDPTPKTSNTPVQIRHMALKVWKEGLLQPLHHHLVAALLEEIRRERVGEAADLSMVRDVVGSFVEVDEGKAEESLRYYQECFEGPFLVETGHYYRLEAAQMVAELSCSEYIKHVVGLLQTAKHAGLRFLHQTSVTKFVRECESCLVVHYKDTYIYTHARDMVRQENATDLSNLFVLFNGIPRALQPVIQEFEDHVKEQGVLALRQLYQDRGYSPADFVNAVLTIHSKYQSMISSLFSSHQDFTTGLDRACRTFVNLPERPRQQPKAPLLLARYCDQLLRKSSKGVGDGVEERLQEAITVFRYVEDKDMFQRFYSRMLSRRLVQSLSLSMEAEETMIYKLKHACGYEYTARLQRMVVDIRLSSDAMTDFHEQLVRKGDSLPISFSTMVLQCAAWPLQKSTCPVSIPAPLQLAKTKFEGFYTSKHSGRVLSWLHHLSVAELRMMYLKRLYTVCVSTHQMAVLLAYNQTTSHSMASLAQCTQLPSNELTSTVQSLVESRILEQAPAGGGVAEEERGGVAEDRVRLNMNYSNKRTKFKVTAMLQKDSQQEVEQTLYNVTEDRKLHIQAAIVRVMKARKSLQHNQLIQETISQVRSRFTPNVQTIKRCIETLMEKQYLERQQEARDSYTYVA